MWDKKQKKCGRMRKYQKRDQEKGASKVATQDSGILQAKLKVSEQKGSDPRYQMLIKSDNR